MSESPGPGMGRPSGPEFTGPPLPDSQLPDSQLPDSQLPDSPLPDSPLPDSAPSGPPVAGARPAGAAPASPGGPRPPAGPPARRLPAVLTALAIAVVTVVVVIASVLAGREDVRKATPRPAPAPSTSVSPIRTDRIEFTTSSGSGVLEIVDHAWDSDGTDVEAPGSLLTIAVEVTCQGGILRYGPDSFQAFDRNGDLFDPVVLPDSPTALEFGTLSAGQQVSGTVAFDIPRGGVTLLMSDESSRTVTALKVPD